MIPNLVSHVRNELDAKIKSILGQSYIIREVLGDVENDVATSFIDKYADVFDQNTGERTKDGLGIKILTNYPQDIQPDSLFILVGMGSGQESIGNLGMSTSGYTQDSSGIIKETGLLISKGNGPTEIKVKLTSVPDEGSIVIPSISGANISYNKDTSYLYVDLPKPVYDSLDFSVNNTLQVNYSSVTGNGKGMGYGFIIDESVSILIVSNNLDDIRLTDTLIKAALILMRMSSKEFTKYSIGKISYSAPVPLQEVAPSTPNIIFGREIDVSYSVDYSLNYKNTQVLNKAEVDVLPK